MLGYFSVEWVFLAVLGFAAALFGGSAIQSVGAPPATWAVAVVSSLAFFGLLRLAGRTPIGITYESHPAARGHPVLSVLAFIICFSILGFHILSK